MAEKFKIILGSESKSRRKIMEEMGYEFEVMLPNIDEKSIRFNDPEELTLAIANAKADTLLQKIKKEAILLTYDQVVVSNGRILEKPKNKKEAEEFLKLYRKYPAETVTAAVAVNTISKRRVAGIEKARVWFRPLPHRVIRDYIASGDAFDQCGGFSIDASILRRYIDRIEGAEDSIIGLPKELTKKLIRDVSI